MMEINPAKLQEEIDAFKRGVYNKNSNIFNVKTTIKALKVHAPNENVGLENIHPAVRLAYLDAKRTMSQIDNKNRDYALAQIETVLHDYFNPNNSAPSSKEKFDNKHKELCEIWCNCFRGSNIGTFGKAQKIVNMSFKYLFCCKDAADYKAYFKYCHMPLDSFTLEWFKRDVTIKKWFKNEVKENKKPRLIIGKMASWSALGYDAEDDPQNAMGYYTTNGKKNYYSYLFYLENIRTFIEANGFRHSEEPKELLSPLELEFVVWSETQKKQAAEDFLSGLEEDLYLHGNLSKDKYKLRKKSIITSSLKENYDRISEILKSQGIGCK